MASTYFIFKELDLYRLDEKLWTEYQSAECLHGPLKLLYDSKGSIERGQNKVKCC